ncbi:MAG TPA: thiolase family protein [Steroidobacteraceae bacterium]|nr:thiolase family protein [Steroidobacteraceae bacterium]
MSAFAHSHVRPARRRRAVTARRQRYTHAVVTTPVTVPYVRYSNHGAHWFAARALAGLLEGSGLDKADVDGLCLSSFTLAPDTAVGVTQHLGLSLRWLDHIPMGGAAGVVALRRAARAVQAGDAQVVACVAADTHQPDTLRTTVAAFSRFTQDAVYPYGAGGPNASFALLTSYYMRSYGAKREDFGKLCIAQRSNALSFPHALLREPLTLEQYLAARPIAEPLCLFDCVMPCAGGEGFLVMRPERARDLGLKSVSILGTLERHNAFPEDPIQMRGGWGLDREALFAEAGVRHEQVDFLQTYDDYPVISLLQIEDLGFCAKGEGPHFVRSHTFTHDGTFPHNTSGGQLSVGQAGAAGGYLGLTEAVRQLTGAVLGSAVRDARIGLVSGFGMINYDRGLCCAATLLAREES